MQRQRFILDEAVKLYNDYNYSPMQAVEKAKELYKIKLEQEQEIDKLFKICEMAIREG